MAYNARNLSVLAYANGFTLWHYTTEDDAIAMLAPEYFDAARDMLRSGDRVLTPHGDIAVMVSGYKAEHVRVSMLSVVRKDAA